MRLKQNMRDWMTKFTRGGWIVGTVLFAISCIPSTPSNISINGTSLAVSTASAHAEDTQAPDANVETAAPEATALQQNLQIGLYETLELVFAASNTPKNPFDTYLLKLEVTDPSGRTFQMDGFYDGDGRGGQNGKIWKARLSPYMTGLWRWRTIEGDAPDGNLANKSGEFEVVQTDATGGVVRDGKYFHFQNGDPVFLVGNFLDFTNGLRTTHTFMSETTNDRQRDQIMERQRNFHQVNKANIYFANKGDYDNQSVTPWAGNKDKNDKNSMDLGRWRKYDEYIRRFQDNQIVAEMWFFADDSNFGGVSKEHKERLARYAMARTSAFSHTMYVVALEWQEGWNKDEVRSLGKYLQSHNPWDRLVSVHSLTGTDFAFGGDDWVDFMALQAGNDSDMDVVSKYAIAQYDKYNLPHLSEEFGILRSDSDKALRSRMWASFAGGSAGVGTGSDLKAMQRFLAESRIPFQKMRPANNLVSGGGSNRFALADPGHHYMVYSAGGSFELEVSGNLQGVWFNPRSSNASLEAPFQTGGGRQTFTPPSSPDQDWVLFLSDGSGLNPGVTHMKGSNNMLTVPVNQPSQEPDREPVPFLDFLNFVPFTSRP